MEDKTQTDSVPSKFGSIVYFSYVVLVSSFILWIFICITMKLDDIPIKQFPESMLYPIMIGIIVPGFLNHVAGKCLKSIPLGKYTKIIGMLLIFVITILLVIYVGLFDITFVKGKLLL
ncbi:MAG: hypothetical protein K0R84_1172 [Clostridia bacterium]|nr:hypothetical protein [Clostridia bacterium]